MTTVERGALALGLQPVIRNVARFIADFYVSLPALRGEFKTQIPADAALQKSFRAFRSLWLRAVHVRVTDASTAARSESELYRPFFELLGFEAAPARREIELDPERVVLGAYGTHERVDLLVDMLPFGRSPDDRLERGEFRGSAQRRMVWALAASGARFGAILGAGRLRLVALDTANEPRYLEFDLGAIVERDDGAAFGVLATLFSPAFLLGEAPLLARLVEKSDARGTAVSEALGPAARRALQALLEAVRTDERNAAWTPATFVEGAPLREIHREGIYVLYRLLFVLFAEAANALPLDKPLYREAYSVERMRDELSGDVTFSENSYALWDGVKALFRLADIGARTVEFEIPAYNGGLFCAKHTLVLDGAWISDFAFAEVLRELTTVCLGKGKRATRDRVSFRELGVAQLGAVFEGLLDYEPHVAHEDLFEVPTGTGKAKGISFLPASALGAVKRIAAKPDVRDGEFYLQAWGGQRKSTGAYYTPRVIADYLVREALRSQVEGLASDAILEIAVCDPAMGSGGFLVSATEFLGDAYYRARVAEETFDPNDERADDDRIAAKRIVAERCIYGVDVNPMAVELAKVSLWLTTLSYDRPLSFFDHHLRCGNSLLGAPLRDENGKLTSKRIRTIPAAALAPVDKEASKEERAEQQVVAKRNVAQLKAIEDGGNLSLFTLDLATPLAEYAAARQRLSADDPTQSAQDAVELIRAKERHLRDLTEDPRSPFFKLKEIADLWMAPWFWPHDPHTDATGKPLEPPMSDDYAIITGEILSGGPRSERGQRVLDESRRLARRLRFFHWEIEFPEVFERGGFHAIVGNPPWETLSPKTKEFFSNYIYGFQVLKKQKAVSEMSRLRTDRAVDFQFRQYASDRYQISHFLRLSLVYPLLAADGGNIDLFRAFVERDYLALRRFGSIAQVLPSSFYVNRSCASLRSALMCKLGSIRAMVVNQNERFVFPIEHRMKVLTLIADRGIFSRILFAKFFVGKDKNGHMKALTLKALEQFLARPKLLSLPLELIERLFPGQYSVPEIDSPEDILLINHLSLTGQRFSSSPWVEADTRKSKFCSEVHTTSKSNWFTSAAELADQNTPRNSLEVILGDHIYYPLVQGRNFYQYEFPNGQFDYYIEASISTKLARTNDRSVNSFGRLAWRDVARSTDERTIIASYIPPNTFLSDKAPSIRGGLITDENIRQLEVLFNSFVFDWQCRLRGATSQKFHIIMAAFLPIKVEGLDLRKVTRSASEAAVMDAYRLPFNLAEYIMSTFPLLDRLQPKLAGESSSTISRDSVLAAYAELLNNEKGHWYRERCKRAGLLGAIGFIPASREEPLATETDDDDEDDSADYESLLPT